MTAGRRHGDRITTAAFSPDGQRVVTASYDGTARVWGAEDGRLLATLQGHTETVYDVTFSPDGQRVFTASADGTARLWNLDPTVARSVGCMLVRDKPVWREHPQRDALHAACASVP